MAEPIPINSLLPAQNPSDLSTGSFGSPAQTTTQEEKKKVNLASNLEN